MKAVVLYTNTGGGHKSAAIAVAESLKDFNVKTKLVDSLRIAGENVTSRISRRYDRIVKVSPAFFGMLYNAGKKVGRYDRKSIIYFLNTLYASKVYNMLKEEKPDIIICTHLFSAETITYLENKYNIKAVTAAVITDYNSSPLWEETSLDYYMIPHDDILHEFTDKNMPERKFISTGIPVTKEFAKHIDKKKAKIRLGYDSAKFHILVMGGSMGAGDIYEIADALYNGIADVQITVICGKNKKLYDKFQEADMQKKMRVLQFANSISQIMDSADVIITKPGGLTSTEAMVKGMPVIIVNPIPGCETDNCSFFTSRNMAVYSKSPQNTVECCRKIMNSMDISQRMIDAQKKYIYTDAGIRISKFLIEKAKERS